MIRDRFTHLKISPQHRYQLRQKAKGRCRQGCGRKLKPGYAFCTKCLEKQKERYQDK